MITQQIGFCLKYDRLTAAMRLGRSTTLTQIALRYRFGQLRIAAKR